jgi:O-acetyl-ADP-ribose deacetylase (regulator of RNase III)
MTIHVKGDVFQIARAMQSPNRRVAIGHGCNMRGVMGAGFAALIRQQFPVAHRLYVNACQTDSITLGDTQMVFEEPHNLIIMNMFTQDLPGANADLVALECALDGAMRMKGNGVPLVIPEIGSGIGGLDVEECRQIFYKHSDDLVLVSYA